MTFALAMVKNPHVWKRAQVEIDAMIGTGRLPEFDDRQNLPYIDAIVRETLRWRPVVPLGTCMAANVFEAHLADFVKVFRTRSSPTMYTRVTIFLKVCSEHALLLICLVNERSAQAQPSLQTHGMYLCGRGRSCSMMIHCRLGPCRATKLGIPMQRILFPRDSWMPKGC